MAKQIIYDGDKKGVLGKSLAQSLNLLGNSYVCTHSLDEVEQGIEQGELDYILFVTPDVATAHEGNRLKRKSIDTPFLFLTVPGKRVKDVTGRIRGQQVSSVSLDEIIEKTQGNERIKSRLQKDYGFAFEANPEGLTAVLMEQFSEPLLCFRELVQNSVDAEADRIEINTGYDPDKGLLAIDVYDDGDGMTLDHIQTYLTLFDSTKDEDIRKIGQMGAGKVFAHALGPKQMVVETGDGQEGHKVVFNGDLSGRIVETTPYQGTNVKLLLPLTRPKAREFNKKLEEVVRDWCKHVKTPLYVNGKQINESFDVEGIYKARLSEEGLEAVIALGHGRYGLFKGGILLEDHVYGLFNEYENGKIVGLFRGLIDAENFDFPISRNGVVRNYDFERIFAGIKKSLITEFTPRFIEDTEADKVPKKYKAEVRRFFYHILANNGYHDVDSKTLDKIRTLPILENVDGSFLSVDEVRERIGNQGYLYHTLSDLSSTELSAFIDKGIPVLRDPHDLVTSHIFERAKKQSLDSRHYVERLLIRVGDFDLSTISDLLTRGFVSKVSASSVGGGFLGDTVGSDGTYDNPFDFSKIGVYGAEFKDLQGNPEENVLLDSQWSQGYDRRMQVIFNVNHPFMRSMSDLSQHNLSLAQYFIACELIKSRRVFGGPSHKIRENEMSRIGLKVVDND
ncbi:hypothetical protein CMI42_02325 [Candidatus Pacearchaeota archaeon]|nr:hypothetical protein [Candidatus Pacearchaeota archaeon]|tara:strand:+ start:537 stop:2567 length:2031 start_codon:yes stop_codon:yes gene_type:complete